MSRSTGIGLRWWQSGCELPIDEQAPHVAERHLADEIFDVDTAVAQRAAVAVRLGDLCLERDDAFETRLGVGQTVLLSSTGVFWAHLPVGSARFRRDHC